jgi:hypothetical protein
VDLAAAEEAFLSAYPNAGEAGRELVREIVRRGQARYGTPENLRAVALRRLGARGVAFEEVPAFPWFLTLAGFICGIVPGILVIIWHESRSSAATQRNMQRAMFAARQLEMDVAGPEQAMDWLLRYEVATMFQESGEEVGRELEAPAPRRAELPVWKPSAPAESVSYEPRPAIALQRQQDGRETGAGTIAEAHALLLSLCRAPVERIAVTGRPGIGASLVTRDLHFLATDTLAPGETWEDQLRKIVAAAIEPAWRLRGVAVARALHHGLRPQALVWLRGVPLRAATSLGTIKIGDQVDRWVTDALPDLARSGCRVIEWWVREKKIC